MYTHKKHLFFDLDDTVTLSRTPMGDAAYELYRSLPHDIIIVSGAEVKQIDTQIRKIPFFRLGQNGNQALNPENKTLWQEDLNQEQCRAIEEHIAQVRALTSFSVQDENDLVENRGSQISYSLIGHHEDIVKKKACDPDKKIRLELLEKVPLTHPEIEVKIGGTTCLDYFAKGKNKGYNIKKLIAHMGWDTDACLYFGDALFPGGNDETVIGIIDTHPVDNHEHTYELLKQYFTE